MRLFFFIVLVLVAIAAVIAAVSTRGKFTKEVPFAAAAVAAVAVLVAVVLCFAVVPARSVGIKIAFGKTNGALDSGLHLRAPWETIENYPSTIQTVRFQGQGGKDVQPCITVRLGNQTTACVDVTTQWSLNTADKKAIEDLYVKWRSFDNIQPSLVEPQIKNALLQPFETFNPLSTLAVSADASSSGVAPTGDLATQAKQLLQSAVGTGVTINTLTINLVNYDQTTQDRINAFQAEQANTRIAVQREQTSQATSRANQALAASGTGNVDYQNCLDYTANILKEGKQLPAAWSCGTPPQPVVNVR